MKHWLKKQANRIRKGERAAAPLDALLALGTPIFRIGMRRRLAKPRMRVDARVISFGNLTAGGSGKTPAVIERALEESAAGHTVAVISRGYGSHRDFGWIFGKGSGINQIFPPYPPACGGEEDAFPAWGREEDAFPACGGEEDAFPACGGGGGGDPYTIYPVVPTGKSFPMPPGTLHLFPGSDAHSPLSVRLAERSAVLGDELALIAFRAPLAIPIKSADRVEGARTAIQQYGCDTILLDDGFQQPVLERDENILVVNATNPSGNGMLLPRGILREPLEAMARATAVILTHCDRVDGAALAALEECIHKYAPGAPIRKTRHAPNGLWRVCDGKKAPLETLRGATVTAACAIANPESFWRTLEELGAFIGTRQAFRDHGVFTAGGLPATPEMVVVTEKDAMRLNGARENVWALGIKLETLNRV